MGNAVADAAARIRRVSDEPRDEMEVNVHHRLARRDAGVDAEVVAVGVKLRIEPYLRIMSSCEEVRHLFGGELEPVRNVAIRNQQCVPARYRIAVSNRDRELRPRDDSRLGERAERTRTGCVVSFSSTQRSTLRRATGRYFPPTRSKSQSRA
jgi:hypothetical protein